MVALIGSARTSATAKTKPMAGPRLNKPSAAAVFPHRQSELPGDARLVVNEQLHVEGADHGLTVNAVHLTMGGLTTSCSRLPPATCTTAQADDGGGARDTKGVAVAGVGRQLEDMVGAQSATGSPCGRPADIRCLS